jgi:general secretion pathway protein J
VTRRSNQAGFTLVELTIALVLLALLGATVYGSLNLAGESVDRGEAKADSVSGMRLTQEFLRTNLESQHPLRMRKLVEFPLLFSGERDEIRYAAALPPRVSGGGIWFYRIRVDKSADRSPLVLERIVPDLNALELPEFNDAERVVLAQDIDEITIGYYGRDPDSAAANTDPTWRDRWADRQQIPLLLRIDVKPKKGAPWPTLVVSPREAAEAGCHSYDIVRQRCVGV